MASHQLKWAIRYLACSHSVSHMQHLKLLLFSSLILGVAL